MDGDDPTSCLDQVFNLGLCTLIRSALAQQRPDVGGGVKCEVTVSTNTPSSTAVTRSCSPARPSWITPPPPSS